MNQTFLFILINQKKKTVVNEKTKLNYLFQEEDEYLHEGIVF